MSNLKRPMAFTPQDVRGWRGWLASAGFLAGCYGGTAVLGWFAVSGGAHSTLDDQPVSSWLVPLGMASAALGVAALFTAYRTAPPVSESTPAAPRWFLPAFGSGIVAAAILGTLTASLAAPHSEARWAPIPILGLALVVSALIWHRQRTVGST